MTQTSYRPDIDGLRAVAVLAVVVFHALPAWLPGGFTGVDMFFVISGYLISGIVYKGQRERSFTYADFYARRIRRIFPALIAVLVLCLAYGWLVLLPAEYERLGGHAAAGTVFLQNVAFYNESGYFDTDANLKPLLHLWSLAVEEQIYLVFPPIVLFVLWRGWPILPVLALLLAVSFVANLLMAERSVSADFFLTPFRTWEFLAGAILAWIHDRHGQASLRARPAPCSSWPSEAAAWCGALLLAAGLAWIDEKQPYPGWRAVVPVLGTLLIIAAGQAATINRAVLSLAPVVWIGLISYPLYLFHWPLISFVHIIEGDKPAPRLIAAAVALSLILAIASYYALERRVRHNRWRWTVPILLACFIAVGAAGVGIWKGRIPPKPPSPEVRLVDEAIAEARAGWGQYGGGYRHRNDHGISVTQCGGDGPKTLFLGDSNMVMYAPRIRKVLEESGSDRGAIFVALGGACPVPGVTRDDIENEEHLIPVFETVLESDPAIDRVVIGARWSGYLAFGKSTIDGTPVTSDAGRLKLLDGFGGLVERCRNAGKRVTVVLEVPSARPMDPNRMVTRSLIGGRVVRIDPYSVAAWKQRSRRNEELAAVAEAKGADVIDPLPFLSENGTCLAANEDGPIRSDHAHLRGRFVRDHVTYLDATVSDGNASRPDSPKPAPRPEPRLVSPWHVFAHGKAKATLVASGANGMKIDIERLDEGQPWHIQLRGPKLAILPEERYVVSFRARAAAPRTLVVTVGQNHEPWQAVGLFVKTELTAEWRDFRLEFTGSIDEPDAILRINVGASDVAVEFDDVTIAPLQAP